MGRNDFYVGMYEDTYLSHGLSGWVKKGHKYISRMWKHGKWVYTYKITGEGYRKAARENALKSAVSKGHLRRQYSRLATAADYNYRNNSLAGRVEGKIDSGVRKARKALNLQEPETIIRRNSNVTIHSPNVQKSKYTKTSGGVKRTYSFELTPRKKKRRK